MNTSLRDGYLDAMGVQRWIARDALPEAEPVADAGIGAFGWDELEECVSGCTMCALHESRTRTVFGSGNRGADWMIIGEAPGAEEDRQGLPFVGRAGELLTEMLSAVGLRRDDVYICNILKCRPPDNRNPTAEEAACCSPYLARQVELVQPRLILAVGGIAANTLLEMNEKVGNLRGRTHHYGPQNIPLVVTYHPAYLLRSPQEKRKSWDDLLLARSVAAAGGG